MIPDLEHVFIEHTFQIAIEAMKLAHGNMELDRRHKKLAGKPALVKIPKSFADLMRLYDLWRKGQYTPKRPKKLAVEIQKSYLKKVSSVWEKYSRDFREGRVYNQDEVRGSVRRIGKTTESRAANIVRTETTTYYNVARREYYDQSPDVTHYLFVPVRDAGTTKWCTWKVIDGKHGRSGLVYTKGAAITDQETPSCHYGCRSELLPLTPDNPTHLKLINDKSIRRENVICFPLLPGWRPGSKIA